MKAYEEVEFFLHSFSTEALEGGGPGASGAGSLILRNRIRYLLERRLRVPPRPSGRFAGKKKGGASLFPPGNEIALPGRPAITYSLRNNKFNTNSFIQHVYACNIRIGTPETPVGRVAQSV